MKKLKALRIPLLVIFLVLFIDQFVKIWVKTHLYLGEEIPVFGNWFIINFVENYGMAFGMQFGGESGKIILTSFRIIAAGLILWYLIKITLKGIPKGLQVAIALIFVGAVGNIVDSVFYGLIFSDSLFEIARMFPAEGGYAGLFHGRVVDMLYFPLFSGDFPSWFPIWGGQHFTFFQPVFNLADASITTGVCMILVFQKRYFPKKVTPDALTETAENTVPPGDENKTAS
ncbi:MAG: lipoprotein signal peptidase [Bacteroidota bacterium]